MTTKEKLLEFIRYKHISKKRFYEITGFSNGFLDSGKYIGTDKLEIILNEFPDLSFKWLILGEGNMIKDPNEETAHKAKGEAYSMVIDALEDQVQALNSLIEEKERLVNEKERIIELLMNKN